MSPQRTLRASDLIRFFALQVQFSFDLLYMNQYQQKHPSSPGLPGDPGRFDLKVRQLESTRLKSRLARPGLPASAGNDGGYLKYVSYELIRKPLPGN
jgi:hypothetical protein